MSAGSRAAVAAGRDELAETLPAEQLEAARARFDRLMAEKLEAATGTDAVLDAAMEAIAQDLTVSREACAADRRSSYGLGFSSSRSRPLSSASNCLYACCSLLRLCSALERRVRRRAIC